jgi:tRNA-Thr(GGU) m(6)t(6)A37 methyltransferase TsaA
MEIEPIGVVVGAPEDEHQVIEVKPEFAEGLHRIEEREHLWILFWMHRLGEEHRRTLKVHPRGDPSRGIKGVFALHSPMRPNPIGMTRVKLVRREGSRLIVEGLDALDGSPVIDIKSG